MQVIPHAWYLLEGFSRTLAVKLELNVAEGRRIPLGPLVNREHLPPVGEFLWGGACSLNCWCRSRKSQGRPQTFLLVKALPSSLHTPILFCSGELVSLRPFLKMECQPVAKLVPYIRCILAGTFSIRITVVKKCLYNYRLNVFLVCWRHLSVCVRILHPAGFSYPCCEGSSVAAVSSRGDRPFPGGAGSVTTARLGLPAQVRFPCGRCGNLRPAQHRAAEIETCWWREPGAITITAEVEGLCWEPGLLGVWMYCGLFSRDLSPKRLLPPPPKKKLDLDNGCGLSCEA